MAYVDCVVDTTPMAAEIDSVSRHIKGTTTAVVAMQTAVIKAEVDAAETVCENVNKGFYTLIHSQISQKIAKLQSEVDSHLMKLCQHRKQLNAIKDRMGKDYGMITARYVKLFGGLNKNLENRIYELDKPVMKFAQKEISTISNRSKHLTATVPVSQSESLSVSQRILASEMKYRSAGVIESMNRFLASIKVQNELSEKILLPITANRMLSPMMVPVLVCESNYDKYDNKRVDIVVNNTGLSQASQNAIKNVINGEELAWNEETNANQEIKSEFNRFLSQSGASERVKKLAEEMFMANGFKTIKK